MVKGVVSKIPNSALVLQKSRKNKNFYFEFVILLGDVTWYDSETKFFFIRTMKKISIHSKITVSTYSGTLSILITLCEM